MLENYLQETVKFILRQPVAAVMMLPLARPDGISALEHLEHLFRGFEVFGETQFHRIISAILGKSRVEIFVGRIAVEIPHTTAGVLHTQVLFRGCTVEKQDADDGKNQCEKLLHELSPFFHPIFPHW